MNNFKLMTLFTPVFLFFLELVFKLSHYFQTPKIALCLFLATWMVSWWVLEILPLGITALIPIFYLPFLGVLNIKQVTPSYSNPVIFLFLGGFIIARALEKTKLDERIALSILAKTGKSDKGIILGFIIATAFLSMWISNTATTVMMVPIALAVAHFLKENLSKQASKDLATFNLVLFLSIAYSANIGGIATPIGTPPNVVFMGFLEELYQRNIDFYYWFFAMGPLAIALLTTMFFTLKKIYPFQLEIPKQFNNFIKEKLNDLGDISKEQRVTISLFLLASGLWTFKGLIHYFAGNHFLNDTSIAIFSGLLLFLIPSDLKNLRPVLGKDDISKLPWDIVLLFGGGMALATSLKEVGLIQLATQFFSQLELSSIYILIFLIAGTTLFLTEIMSNVALCVVALPLIMKLGEAQTIDPILIALPAALCSSFAFSMPISTPPNAIVFGTNLIKVKQMLKAGIALNFIALLLTMSLGYYLIQFLIVN